MRFSILIAACALLGCGGSGPKLWQVGTDADWQSVAAGFQSTCAVKQDGRVFCWGRNDYGQLPGHAGNSKVPVEITLPQPFASMARPQLGVCGQGADGTLYCWGFSTHHDLGGGSNLGPGNPVLVAQSGTDWSSLSKGSEHTCAVRQNQPYCWGGNAWQELGDAFPYETAEALVVPHVGSVTAVDAFSHHTCALTTEGKLWCWGGGNDTHTDGGLSLDTGSPPKLISEDTDWASFSTGVEFGVAVKQDGSLWQWGRFGRGDAEPVHQIGEERVWSQVSAGELIACGIKQDGSLHCWGSDDYELLLGKGEQHQTPTRMDPEAFKQVSCGTTHACAVKTNGTLWCWGEDKRGQVGNGSDDENGSGGHHDD